MHTTPTVIILADVSSDQGTAAGPAERAMGVFNALDTTLRRVIAAGLPLILVAPQTEAQAALNLLPSREIVLAPPAPLPMQPRGDWLVSCVARAVMASPQSPGWLLLPADMPMLRPETLHAVAQGHRNAPIVYPRHRHKRGHPVAFSSELYAELSHMSREQDLRRLAARYPCADVDVDDPGIHMLVEPSTGLNQWRAQLTGPMAYARASPHLNGVVSSPW